MTEAQWLSDTPPNEWLLSPAVLQYLHGRTSDRKLWLFAVTCCHLIQHLLDNARSRVAIEVSERHADGLATDENLARADREASAVADADEGNCDADMARAAAAYVAKKDVLEAADGSFGYATHPALHPDDTGKLGGIHLSSKVNLLWALLHDIVGNPFRPVSVDLTWQSSTVVSLAQAIYDDRAFDRMPILADALEDAGCTNADVLDHCRGAGPHVRGCWVVDLLLGKQ